MIGTRKKEVNDIKGEKSNNSKLLGKESCKNYVLEK